MQGKLSYPLCYQYTPTIHLFLLVVFSFLLSWALPQSSFLFFTYYQCHHSFEIICCPWNYRAAWWFLYLLCSCFHSLNLICICVLHPLCFLVLLSCGQVGEVFVVRYSGRCWRIKIGASLFPLVCLRSCGVGPLIWQRTDEEAARSVWKAGTLLPIQSRISDISWESGHL